MKIFKNFLRLLSCMALIICVQPTGNTQAATTCVSEAPFAAGRILTDGEIVLADQQLNALRGFKYQSSTPHFTEFPVGPRNLQTYDEIVIADMDGQ